MSISELVPRGLLEPSLCSRMICTEDSEMMINGRIKCRAKNRVRVGSLIENPPQSHVVSVIPRYGIAVRRLVITVAAQNDICPHGRTYPKKAVAIRITRRAVPDSQTSLFRYKP